MEEKDKKNLNEYRKEILGEIKSPCEINLPSPKNVKIKIYVTSKQTGSVRRGVY